MFSTCDVSATASAGAVGVEFDTVRHQAKEISRLMQCMRVSVLLYFHTHTHKHNNNCMHSIAVAVVVANEK